MVTLSPVLLLVMVLSPSEIWDFLTVSSQPGLWMMWVVGFVVAVVGMWKVNVVFQPFSTLAHEFSHALASAFTNSPIKGIKVHMDGSGVTEHYGSEGLKRVFITIAGYPGPVMLGVSMLLLQTDYPRIMVSILIALSLWLLLLSRSLFTLVVSLSTVALMGAMMLLPLSLVSTVLLVCGGALSGMGAWETVQALHVNKMRRIHGGEGLSDWETLEHIIGGSSIFWSWVFIIIVAALIGVSLFIVSSQGFFVL